MIMEKAINLIIDDSSVINECKKLYYNKGIKYFHDNFDKNVEAINVDDFQLPDGTINATKVQENCFPQIDANVFISHSHKDENLAIALSGLLAGCGRKPFVDSKVWKYFDTLLKGLNGKFSRNTHGQYDYDDCMKIAGHVHTMLVSSLAMMIKQCNCVVFLNTPNSITEDKNLAYTWSPWIYTELLLTRLMLPEVRKMLNESRTFSEQVKFMYSLNTDFLKSVNLSDLVPFRCSRGTGKTFKITEEQLISYTKYLTQEILCEKIKTQLVKD